MIFKFPDNLNEYYNKKKMSEKEIEYPEIQNPKIIHKKISFTNKLELLTKLP